MKILCSLVISLFLISPYTSAQERSKEVLLPLLKQKVAAQQIDTQRVNILNELSWAYHRSNADSSKIFAEKALQYSIDLDYPKGKARALNLLAIYYSNEGASLKSMELNDSCYNIASIIPDSFLMTAALNDNANIKLSFGLKGDALEDYFKALELTPHNNLVAKVFTLSNIGIIYQMQGDSALAEKYILNSMELAENSSNPFIKSASIINYLNYLDSNKDYQELKVNARKAIRLAKLHQDNFTLIIAYAYLGKVNQSEGLFESALNYFEKAEDIAISSNSKDQLLYIYGSMATIYNSLNKPDQVIFFVDKAMETIIDQETQDANTWLFGLYAEAFSTKGDFEKAYQYQKIFKAKTDSLNNKNLEKTVHEITIKNELAIEKKERKEIEAKKAEQAKALSYQKKFTQALLIVGFLALSLVIVLLSAYRNKNRYNDRLKQKVKEQTNSLQQKNTELASSNEELENFAHITSHDLKEPVRNILSFSKILMDNQANLSPVQQQHYTNIVYSRAKRVNILLEDVLEFSKIRKGIKEVNWIAPNEIIQNIQEELKRLIKEKNVIIHVNDIPTIHFGETELFLILKNLIENGIKYNKSEKPTLHIEYKAEESYHHFSVQDNGIGVEKGFEKKIFAMFFRLHNKQDFEGTGLGLAICKRILEKVNGKIWLETQKNKGSIFHFTIPKI